MIEVKATAATPMAMTTSVRLKAEDSRKGREVREGFLFWLGMTIASDADVAWLKKFMGQGWGGLAQYSG